ncbi:MAG TPA: hypothetical protein VIV11_32525 [Kofleriaceae bacterium]
MRIRHTVVLAALCGCSFEHGSEPEPDASAPDVETIIASDLDKPPPVWRVVETLTIDTANPKATLSKMVLEAGAMYRLRASGTASVIDGIIGDADYYDFANPKDNACCEDVGIGIDDPAVDLTTTPDWGPYNADHVYEITWMGTGTPLSAAYQDTVYGNNSGNLTIEILVFD